MMGLGFRILTSVLPKIQTLQLSWGSDSYCRSICTGPNSKSYLMKIPARNRKDKNTKSVMRNQRKKHHELVKCLA